MNQRTMRLGLEKRSLERKAIAMSVELLATTASVLFFVVWAIIGCLLIREHRSDSFRNRGQEARVWQPRIGQRGPGVESQRSGLRRQGSEIKSS